MEGMIDRDALTRYVDRVLVLHNERKTINTDIGEVYEEAKSAGFVTKIIRQIVREKQMDAEERAAHYNLLDTYRHALGMLADTPLGEAGDRCDGTPARPSPSSPCTGLVGAGVTPTSPTT